LLGLLLGLSLIPMRWAAIKMHEYSLREPRWRQGAKAASFGFKVLATPYALGYPYILKWHFQADSIFSEWPPQFQRAMASYALGLGIGLGCYLWKIKWPRDRERYVGRV
jgi:hypothetical protein